MKSFYTHGITFALGFASLMQAALLQDARAEEPFGAASLLPLPTVTQSYEPIQTAYNRRGYQERIASPSDIPPAPQQQQEIFPLQDKSPAAQAYPAPQHQGYADPQAYSGGCTDGSCSQPQGDCGVGAVCGPSVVPQCNRWYVYGGGLVLGRANQSSRALSQNLNTYLTNLSTSDANQDFAGGFEGRVGHVFGGTCGSPCNAIELTYWGITPADQIFNRESGTYPPNGMGPLLGNNLHLVDYDNGTTTNDVRTWMTTSTGIHEVSRAWDYHNVEVNLLGNTYAWGMTPYQAGCGCGPRLQYGWMAGFRYFRFGENTAFYTDYDDTTFDGDDNELVYNINTKNDLWGFQMGGQANWQICNRLSMFGGGRGGVYNNHITQAQSIGGSNGDAVIASGPYAGTPYNFHTTSNALAGIGQVDLGLRYQLGCHFSIQGGYRVVGLAGVATAPGQIADNFVDTRYINRINADDAVLLHGAFIGGTFAW